MLGIAEIGREQGLFIWYRKKEIEKGQVNYFFQATPKIQQTVQQHTQKNEESG